MPAPAAMSVVAAAAAARPANIAPMSLPAPARPIAPRPALVRTNDRKPYAAGRALLEYPHECR